MLRRLIHCLFLMLVIPVGKSSVNAKCSLKSNGRVDSNFKDGDLIIGALMQFSIGTSLYVNDFTSNKWLPACTFSSLYYLRHLLAFMFAIEEINSRSDILPNITLGYMLYDTCVIEYTAIESTLKILSGLNTAIPSYGCHKDSALVAIIGHMLSASSIHISKLSGLYGYPQISYGAMDSIFNDKSQFPYFYRTVPDESFQYEAIVQLLEHFGWSWVGIVTSEDESSRRASNEIQSSMKQRDICIEFLVSISDDGIQEKDKEAITMINKSRCSVIILLCNSSALLTMLAVLDNLRKVGIALSSFHIITDLEPLRYLNGSLLFRVQKREIPGLKDFLLQASPLKYPDNLLLRDIWDLYLCSPGNFSNMFNCDYKEVLSSVDPSVFDVTNFRFTFSVYAAVYAVAYALHDMFLHGNLSFTESTSLKRNLQPWELNRYLQKVHFNTPGGEEVFFDELGNSPGKFDIINIVWTSNNVLKRIPVGHVQQSGSDYQISINESAIEWDPHFSQTPRSVCTESCIPGYRKAHQEGRPKCCFNCVPCPEGEITNTTDMKSCFQCPEDQWSNSRRDECVPRSIEYLSYDEPLGLALAVSAVSLSVVTAAVLGIFIIHRDTPVVKANNQNLSFTLLVSLTLSFLCPFLFIGHSTKISCLLRQVTFGIIFTVSVSSILAKTVIVVMAFSATKPNWNLKRYFGKSMASTLVLVCSLGQVVICVAWLIYSPPFPELNTQVEVGKIILQCNEGSVTLFYTDIGYMGILAFFSFVVAFLARKLPDTFNEAQYITFSMLVFCSVWISFIPAYLSTKGKYMVAVEIFAILASGAGLLGCIFIPKCYIIILRPEMNVRINIKNERKGKRMNM